MLLVAFTVVICQNYIVSPALTTRGATALATGMNQLLLVLSILGIMAGGYLINDFYDAIEDGINKRDNFYQRFGKIKTLTTYVILSMAGLIMGLWLALRLENIKLWNIHLLSVLLLYWYSRSLKGLPMAGNLLVAALSASIPLIPLLVESGNLWTSFGTDFILVNFLALYAFIITLTREIVKDLEDVEGDQLGQKMTLPLLVGEKASKSLLSVLFICLISLLIAMLLMFSKASLPLLYITAFLISPSLWLFYKMRKAHVSSEFHFISSGLKMLMLIGILFVPFHYYLNV